MDWKQAFKRQAKSDYKAFVLLNKSVKTENLPVCHCLHYLQMTSEKIAKSFQCKPDTHPPLRHSVLKSFVVGLKATPSIQTYLGYKNNKAFYSFLKDMVNVAEGIEKLAPSGQDITSPNAEYPWQIGSEPFEVVAPADYSFKEIMVNYSKFQWFIEKMLKYEQK